jgi:hypothetical protein
MWLLDGVSCGRVRQQKKKAFPGEGKTLKA